MLNFDVSPSPDPDSNVLHLACASLRGILGAFRQRLAAAWDVGASAGPSRLAPSMLVRASEECHGLAWEWRGLWRRLGSHGLWRRLGKLGWHDMSIVHVHMSSSIKLPFAYDLHLPAVRLPPSSGSWDVGHWRRQRRGRRDVGGSEGVQRHLQHPKGIRRGPEVRGAPQRLLACCCCCLIYDVIMGIALCACFC